MEENIVGVGCPHHPRGYPRLRAPTRIAGDERRPVSLPLFLPLAFGCSLCPRLTLFLSAAISALLLHSC